MRYISGKITGNPIPWDEDEYDFEDDDDLTQNHSPSMQELQDTIHPSEESSLDKHLKF